MGLRFKKILKGERLTLKRVKPTIKMAQLINKEINESRKELEVWFKWAKSYKTVEDSLRFLFDQEELRKKGKLEYSIFLKNKYIGNISIFDINMKRKSAEIGYWISSKYTKNGYATEAVKILEKYAFEKAKLNRIQIRCDEENKASAGVALKCGYKKEGTIRESSFSEYFNNFRNMLIFSKLKSEYDKQ